MRMILCVLLAAAYVHADESEDRRSKLPYIADAVGNTLPPPSNGPATVGSPVNLLTPDRYEFYTFDESGELVKRLMTLEEIQAIVAAGEETEGLVTFANENQPTIAFNFSQPPYTKVHSVVTNVQNVLKAQMEAHKNKPQTHPTLDTPDVSDSWSLILPSIFGNTGVDIVPDKTSNTFTTPETETIELDNSLSKEGSNQIISSSSTKVNEELKEILVTEKMPALTSITAKVTTPTSTTSTTTTRKPMPTTNAASDEPPTSAKLTSTTSKPTTVMRVVSTSSSSTSNPRTTPTTAKTHTTATAKPTTKIVRTTPKPTTAKPSLTTRKTLSTQNDNDRNFTRIKTFTNTPSSTIKSTVQYEKFSTFIPLSTASYITERATTKTTQTTKVSTQTTGAPVQTSRVPIPTSIVPIQPTRAPIETTRVTIQTKRPLIQSTRAPNQTTRAPIQTTRAPIQTTRAPIQTTRASIQKTRAPIQTTRAPIQITSAPIQTTKASSQTTKSPLGLSTTRRSVPSTTKQPSTTTIKTVSSFTTYKPPTSTLAYSSTIIKEETDKNNVTTITTQSVSPSTTVSSTEYISFGNHRPMETKPIQGNDNSNDVTENVSDVNVFDISQSISQIASDLGGNYSPIPTSSDSLDNTQYNEMNLESKENIEIDIPSAGEKENAIKNSEYYNKNSDNFVKISTIEPHNNIEQKVIIESNSKLKTKNITVGNLKVDPVTIIAPVTTTIDPILSESMGDLLSQVVNEVPPKIMESEKRPIDKNTLSTSEVHISTTKENEPNRFKPTPFTPVTKEKEPIDLQLQKTETNVTNQILQIKQVTEKSENLKLSEEVKTRENILPVQEPLHKTEIKQNLTTNQETTTRNEENIENVFQIKLTTAKPLEFTTEKKVEPKNKAKNETATLIEVHSKPNDQMKQIEDLNKNKITTASKEAPQKAEVPVQVNKKPESLTSTANKIIPIENNKIANIKQIDKDVEETSSPKADEFKKKIQKVNIDDKELVSDRNSSWKLISTVAPPTANEIPKEQLKEESSENTRDKNITLEVSRENQGLEVTTKDLNEDIAQFTELCNELAFRYWHTISETIEKKRSFVLSPYSITSMLAMMFMGARGATSGEMNEILKLDDMVTFNPHFTLKNISDSIETTPASGVIVSTFVRELFTDRSKGKVLTFYKERAQHFYNGHVEEVNFKLISDIIRRRTNLLVKRYTWGKIVEYMKANSITMHPPLAAFSANIFETDCSGSSVEGRDGEMYFVVSPNVRQRRLVPVPAVVYRTGFLAGYDPVLDATAAALGNTNSVISTLFLMPGQQGNVVHADDLEQLEKRLLDSNPTTPAWKRLLRTLLPRIGLELQIPRFSHKSLFNVSTTLKKMGLKELFDPEHADLGGLNGPSKDLYLSDMVQSTTMVTCGEGVIGDQHHIEEYPENLTGPQRRRTSRWAAGWDEPRDYQRAFHDPHDVGDAMHLPLHLRPRQARLPSRNAQPARLKFDRPFLYFVRHNPSGMILYVGRYNPRLLP